MYTVSKGPSQIVAKTRRGLAQKLESLDTIRDMTRKNSDSDDTADSPSSMSPPRPVFHAVNGNSKRHHYSNQQRSLPHFHQHPHAHHHHQHQLPQAEALTPQQEDLIRYIYQRWQRVHRELSCVDRATSSESASPPASPSVTYYSDSSPNPALQDFEPFDLEGWWGRRLYHTLTQSL